MKTIAFYVTDLGFGHITRSLALIEQILKYSDHQVYLACGEQQVDYAKVYLNKFIGRVSYESISTEAGTCVKENSFEIDIDETVNKIHMFLDGLDTTVAEQVNTLKDMEVGLIVSDISIVGALVAKQLGVTSVGITNYTHYHRYLKLGIDQQLIKPFIDAYNTFDELFELALADDMEGITCTRTKVGMVARQVNELAVADLKSKYWPSAYLSIGQIANRENIEISFQAGNIYATGNLNVDGNAHVIKLPARIGHSQDYINASSLAIFKAGWSQVAECMIAGIPFGVVDVNPIEDGELISKLVDMDACFVMKESDFDYLNIKKLNMKAAPTQTQKVPNDSKNIAKSLINLV